MAHSCLERSRILVCACSLRGHPSALEEVAEEDVATVPRGQDWRECIVCKRRFLHPCNFEEDFGSG